MLNSVRDRERKEVVVSGAENDKSCSVVRRDILNEDQHRFYSYDSRINCHGTSRAGMMRGAETGKRSRLQMFFGLE